MGVLGVVIGVFLMFSAAVAWIGGDREKAILEDTIKENRKTQAEMSQEAGLAMDNAAIKDDHIKELQDRLAEVMTEERNLERDIAMAERGKGSAADDKSLRGLWESAWAGNPGDGRGAGLGGEDAAKDSKLAAAEKSPGDERAAARDLYGKKPVVEVRALEPIEARQFETLTGMPVDGRLVSGFALCCWDRERR